MTTSDIPAAVKMPRRRNKLRLVIFDCDGVLVDSEPISNAILASALTDLGWSMDVHETATRFVGVNLTDISAAVSERIGRPLPAAWRDELQARITIALGERAGPISGALDALSGVSALGLPWRVASNSSHAEMRVKFARLGLTDLVAGRVHSFEDVAQGKPAPDLFLAAAAAEGVSPAECVVIEDSVTGVRAAVAAGMDCLGFAPHSDGARLRAAGAVPFTSMAELPSIIAASLAPETV